MKEEKETLGRTHIKSRFMRESLVSKSVVSNSKTNQVISIIPDANIIALGGKSIFDRGKAAVFPLVDEIVELNQKHKMILGVSGGVRVRHTYEIGLDLGLPTGGLAMVTGAIEEQNAHMLYALLAKNKGILLPRSCFDELPLYMDTGIIPILICMPPHHYWEKPPREGIIPEYGSDYGIFMVAEILNAKSMIYVKDQEGLYTDNPEKNPKAKLLPKIHVKELIQMDLPDLSIERTVLETLAKSKRVKQIQIINGLKKGNLTRALEGEEIGTIIYNDN